MPRFRFQWANIPDPIRTELALQLKLGAASAETFAAAYGVRPKAEFIQHAWPCLLDCWLFHDEAAAERIASALRAKHIGDTTLDHAMTYLRSCRNAGGLRDIVLAEFIAYGEKASDQLPPVPSRLHAQQPSIGSAGEMQQKPSAPAETDPLQEFHDAIRTILQATQAGATLAVSGDGDMRITYGSSYVFVRLNVTEAKELSLRVYSIVLSEVKATPDLYETLNHINVSLPSGRIFAINDLVVLESTIALDVFSPEYLTHTVETVGFLSDLLDDRLQATFGGTLQIILPGPDSIDV